MELHVNSLEVRDASGAVRGAAVTSEENFAAVQARLEALKDNFYGPAAAQFDAVYNEWHGSALAMNQALDGLGAFLSAAAEAFEETDSALTGALAI